MWSTIIGIIITFWISVQLAASTSRSNDNILEKLVQIRHPRQIDISNLDALQPNSSSEYKKYIDLDQNKSFSHHYNSGQRFRRFIPFARPTVKGINLTAACETSSEDFPDFLSKEQKENGGFLLCLLIGVYCFTLLAIVCDSYFLPCVERICEVLNLSQDVAAATFMSVATSCPELFTNIIGTFITESDIGIGTIVGSSLFNALGVASLGGLAAAKPIKLDWWPLTRDVCIYILAVSLLVGITWDNKIYWYEALVLFIVYFFYFTIMFQNERISKFLRPLIRKNKVDTSNNNEEKVKPKDAGNTASNLKSANLEAMFTKEKVPQPPSATSQISIIENEYNKAAMEKSASSNIRSNSLQGPVHHERHLRLSGHSSYGSYMEDSEENKDAKVFIDDLEDDATDNLFEFPKGKLWKKLLFLYTWPIRFILFFTIPDPRRHPKLFPITFMMCILWIGSNSYVISWMITIIGSVMGIPDAVLGLTFLAAGGCLPESISIIIMSRRGEGSMGVSNSLGANTMNILLSLGMPWFFKTILKGTNSNSFIEIQSGSIEYTILALVAVAIILYLTLYLNKFRLSKFSGTILAIVYIICVVLAILSEMVFFNPDGGSCV